LRPVREIGAVAEGIVDGRYDRRVPAYREEELAAIGDSVNRMVEKLKRLEKARLAGTARLAHELRTPLTILRSSLQGIRDGVVHPDEVPAFIEASLSETTRLQGLVGDLVDLSVLESSDMTLDIQETDINALLDSVVDETRPACQSGGHTLTLDADPGMIASVDPARTRQVLLNLLGNSIRHAGAGRNIQIRATIHGGMLTVSVRDDGPGIQAEVIPQLFERYGRAGAATGSGLGLAISRAIVEAHGGDIRVESDSRTYTMFVFRLPT
jgi:signal transduction histidine kinase